MSCFPEYALKDCESALCLFAAGMGGEHDVQYVHKADIKNVLLVDNDLDKLKKLSELYPDYEYILTDAFDFIEKLDRSFDVIISDQFTHHDFKAWALYDKLKERAKKYLIYSVVRVNIDQGLTLPPGELVKRTNWLGGVYWHITKI